MTNNNIYPTIPAEPSAPLDTQSYCPNIIQGKQQGLLKLKERYKKKYKKYTKILDRLTWLNACSSSISIATGISSVATLITFIGLPVSIPVDAISLTGASISGMATVLTKKYQRSSRKLQNWLTSALAVFEMSISKALKNGEIDEREFGMLQTLYYRSLNELTGFNHKREAENRNQFENSLLEEINI